MASVNWMKVTRQTAGGLSVHLDNEKRAHSKHHSNQHIKTELTKYNYSYGESNYFKALEKLDARTKEVDAEKPPTRLRKDRIVGCLLEIKCPKEIEKAGKSKDFFGATYRLLKNYFGAKNVHAGYVHVDEIHEYVDGAGGEKRESLEHMHVLVSAYTDEKGINGKAFETRSRLNQLNKQMNEMCLSRFGIDYNTNSTPRHKTVEQLKQESQRAELELDLSNLRAENRRVEEIRDKYTTKSVFGAEKGKITLSADDYKDLCLKAELGEDITLRERELKEQAKRLKEQEQILERERSLVVSNRRRLEYDQEVYESKAAELSKTINEQVTKQTKRYKTEIDTLRSYMASIRYGNTEMNVKQAYILDRGHRQDCEERGVNPYPKEWTPAGGPSPFFKDLEFDR